MTATYAGERWNSRKNPNFAILNGQSLSSVEVDSVTLNLSHPNLQTPNQFYSQDNSHYGYFFDSNISDYQLLHYGRETKTTEMPTTGTSTYLGNAIALSPDGVDSGDLTLTADFANKTITNAVTKFPEKTFTMPNATISGNTFSDSAGSVRGKFYGDKAQEVGGTFFTESNGSAAIVFGGTAQ